MMADADSSWENIEDILSEYGSEYPFLHELKRDEPCEVQPNFPYVDVSRDLFRIPLGVSDPALYFQRIGGDPDVQEYLYAEEAPDPGVDFERNEDRVYNILVPILAVAIVGTAGFTYYPPPPEQRVQEPKKRVKVVVPEEPVADDMIYDCKRGDTYRRAAQRTTGNPDNAYEIWRFNHHQTGMAGKNRKRCRGKIVVPGELTLDKRNHIRQNHRI